MMNCAKGSFSTWPRSARRSRLLACLRRYASKLITFVCNGLSSFTPPVGETRKASFELDDDVYQTIGNNLLWDGRSANVLLNLVSFFCSKTTNKPPPRDHICEMGKGQNSLLVHNL